jgi:hypothetical protein
MVWLWMIVGALVGILAAKRRGISPIVGLAAGALLGPFSPLMFFVSGVNKRGDLNLRKCVFCAEKIQPAAIVCRHCGHSLVPSDPAASRQRG